MVAHQRRARVAERHQPSTRQASAKRTQGGTGCGCRPDGRAPLLATQTGKEEDDDHQPRRDEDHHDMSRTQALIADQRRATVAQRRWPSESRFGTTQASAKESRAGRVDLGFPDLAGDPVLDLVTTMRCPPSTRAPQGSSQMSLTKRALKTMALQSGNLSKQEHPKLTNTKAVHWGSSARALAKHELLGHGLGSGCVKARALKPHGLKTGAINRRAFTGVLKQGLSKLKLLQQRLVCQRVWKKQLSELPKWKQKPCNSPLENLDPPHHSARREADHHQGSPQRQAALVHLRVQWSPPTPKPTIPLKWNPKIVPPPNHQSRRKRDLFSGNVKAQSRLLQ